MCRVSDVALSQRFNVVAFETFQVSKLMDVQPKQQQDMSIWDTTKFPSTKFTNYKPLRKTRYMVIGLGQKYN